MIKAQTLKGFRDFLPKEAKLRERLTLAMKSVFAKYGFEPLETPALEYAQTLLGKNGSEADKLLYTFKDHGGRDVGLRYDQTVPLARVIAQYGNELTFPFKRYQVQPVWRAENTQKGRFREFIQCDIDTIGSPLPIADADILATAYETFQTIGITDITIQINDRTIFDNLGLSKEEISVIDKLEKIGEKKVITLLTELGRSDATNILKRLMDAKPTENLRSILQLALALGVPGGFIEFSPTLARGLDYYTSTIFEIVSPSAPFGSLAGGGRFDQLIEKFSGTSYPAVGIAFGFDRIIEVLSERDPSTDSSTLVSIAIYDDTTTLEATKISATLRKNGIATDLAFSVEPKLDRELKFADKKCIPYTVIVGPDEVRDGVVVLKSMKEKTQERIPLTTVIQKLSRDQ